MPNWTAKDERKYEHIKESATERGQGDRAKEIAARTVNKQRREEGAVSERENREGDAPRRASAPRGTSGGGRSQKLEERTKQELLNRARSLDIQGRSKMNKSELITAIRRKNR